MQNEIGIASLDRFTPVHREVNLAPNPFSLEGETALITCGGSGLGFGIHSFRL